MAWKSFKRCLRKVLENGKLNFEEIVRILEKLECRINTRYDNTYQYDNFVEVSHLMCV